ncbi:MAG TPA: M67 family metallopeptidase [Microvirga sp.]|nr:M67 family metallopeptidase [Microvirga sp.]
MKATISRALLDRLRNESAAAGDAEICGLLLGRDAAIEEAVAIPNAAPEAKSGFLLDPKRHIDALRDARRSGKAVIGHYHSHPSCDPFPSPTDAVEAREEGVYWLILAAGASRLWLSRRRGQVLGSFDLVEMAIF